MSSRHVQERAEFGSGYHDRGVRFCWEDGTPPHPDTITRRFKRLAAAAGLPEIDLHDVRHSYATAGRDAKIDWKALSRRIGHADLAFTMKQYVQTDLEADRQVATTLANLIIGGSLATSVVDGAPPAPSAGIRHLVADYLPVSRSVSNRHERGPFRDRKRPLTW